MPSPKRIIPGTRKRTFTVADCHMGIPAEARGGHHPDPLHIPPVERPQVRARLVAPSEESIQAMLAGCSLAQIVRAAEEGNTAALECLRRIYCCAGGWNRDERRAAEEALERLQPVGVEARAYARKAMAAATETVRDEIEEGERALMESRRGQ